LFYSISFGGGMGGHPIPMGNSHNIRPGKVYPVTIHSSEEYGRIIAGFSAIREEIGGYEAE
jgi:hypothetical protein